MYVSNMLLFLILTSVTVCGPRYFKAKFLKNSLNNSIKETHPSRFVFLI
jgi:hypothetical protein